MSGNKNFDLQKCGEILIDIKKIKNKAKSFTFYCAFCSADCDQLKKFTKHLDEKHLNNFEENNEDFIHEKVGILSDDIYELESTKVEQNLCMESFNNESVSISDSITNNVLILDEIDISDTKIDLNINSDPLTNGNKSTLNKCVYNKDLKTEEFKKVEPLEPEVNVVTKIKDAEIFNESIVEQDDDDVVKFKDTINNVDYVDTCDGTQSNSDANQEESIQNIKHTGKAKKLRHDANVSSNDSTDSDFDMEKQLNRYNKSTKVKKKKKEKNKLQEPKQENFIEDNEEDILDTNRIMTKSKRIIKPILPMIIEEYKKCELLWNTNHIAFGVKPKRCEAFIKIAEEITLHFKKKINFRSVNIHIKHLNLLYSKDKKLELLCKKENKEFIPKCKYYTELSFLKDCQGPFMCAICNEMLYKYDPYCHHIANHNGTQPFTCPSCKMGFNNFENFIVHKKRHLALYNFRCNICGKGYPFQSELDWHYTSHTGDKPFLCSICGEGFRGRQALANHVRRHKDPFPHKCHICNKGFVGLNGLNSHIKLHFNVRDILCGICKKGFTHSKYLKRHEKRFHSNKSFNCDECAKQLPSEEELCNHRKIYHSSKNENTIDSN